MDQQEYLRQRAENSAAERAEQDAREAGREEMRQAHEAAVLYFKRPNARRFWDQVEWDQAQAVEQSEASAPPRWLVFDSAVFAQEFRHKFDRWPSSDEYAEERSRLGRGERSLLAPPSAGRSINPPRRTA